VGSVAVLIILGPSHKDGIMNGLAVAVVHKQEPAMGFGAFVGASQRARKRGGRGCRSTVVVEGFVWEPGKACGKFLGVARQGGRLSIPSNVRWQRAWQRWEMQLRLAFKRERVKTRRL